MKTRRKKEAKTRRNKGSEMKQTVQEEQSDHARRRLREATVSYQESPVGWS